MNMMQVFNKVDALTGKWISPKQWSELLHNLPDLDCGEDCEGDPYTVEDILDFVLTQQERLGKCVNKVHRSYVWADKSKDLDVRRACSCSLANPDIDLMVAVQSINEFIQENEYWVEGQKMIDFIKTIPNVKDFQFPDSFLSGKYEHYEESTCQRYENVVIRYPMSWEVDSTNRLCCYWMAEYDVLTYKREVRYDWLEEEDED